VITGAHVIINTTDAEGVRAWFRDVLGFPHVDSGDGWLIFNLPASELGVHPAETSGGAELYLLCDDVEQTRKDLAEKGVESTDVQELPWGSLTMVSIPGGSKLGLYEPKHQTAIGR
jgi:catechol 2,3-dioxygenase-like lactoylglutathione lyase family enzyme